MNAQESKLSNLRRLRFSIEGVGEVVEKFYFPALQYLREQLKTQGRNLEVTFYDLKKAWLDSPNVGQDVKDSRLKFIENIKAWGATYIDKDSPDGEGKRRYDDRESDVTFICGPDKTHADLGLKWLKRTQLICIEKPIDRDLASARKLLSKLRVLDNRVLAFDHYLARFLPSRTQLEHVFAFLREQITSFTFYLIEDGSQGERNGPIENAGRTESLYEGMILDGLPHMAAILSSFGQVESIRVTSVRAGQYTGVDYIDTKRTSINGETLAEVEFVFREHEKGHYVLGKALVGKGVFGSREIPFVRGLFPSDIKLLDVTGTDEQRVRFDLRRRGSKSITNTKFVQEPSTGHLITRNGASELSFALNIDPYVRLMESIVNDSYFDKGIGMYAESGVHILKAMEDMRARDNPDEAYATYPLGPKGGQTLLLEEVIHRLAYVYGEPR